MTNLKLDSVLLIALIIPFIMAFRIGAGDTPYFLFGIIFILLLLYLWLDLIRFKEKTRFLFKQIVLWITISVVIGSAFVSAIVVRHQTHPIYMVHDIVLQQEAAIRFLLDGKNPYAMTYFGTFLEQWNYSPTEVNPALYHFVMQPLYLLFSLPFYYVSNHIIGYFDGRIPLLALFFFTLFIGNILIREKQSKLLFLTFLAFNPAMLPYTLEGRSDMFMFGFLFFSLFLLHKKYFFFSSIVLALAFAVKQSVWPILPFYFIYLYFKAGNLRKIIPSVLGFCAVFLGIVLPFFLWDKKAFLDSTIFYLSGNTPHSYPVSGYGFGKLLQSMGVIKDAAAYYPFSYWQIGVSIPLVIILIKFLKQQVTVKRLILIHTVFLFVFWYFSRYFNNSHLGYLSVLFITAYFWPEEEK